MQIAQVLGRLLARRRRLLRRAMGKKKAEEMAKQRERFVEGAIKNGLDRRSSPATIFDLMETFAGYGFNKSHAAAYALISYQTAYLKAQLSRSEFLAALLTVEIGRHRQARTRTSPRRASARSRCCRPT